MPNDERQSDAPVAVAEPVSTAPDVPRRRPRRMGDRLVELGIVSHGQLEECLELQKSSPGERLGQILIRKGYAKEENVMGCLAEEYGL